MIRSTEMAKAHEINGENFNSSIFSKIKYFDICFLKELLILTKTRQVNKK